MRTEISDKQLGAAFFVLLLSPALRLFPSFAAQFLFALIETMPKFAMEGVLPYESQVFFNAIYFNFHLNCTCVNFFRFIKLCKLASLFKIFSSKCTNIH